MPNDSVCSEAVLSRLVERWSAYPKPLGEQRKGTPEGMTEVSYRVITKHSFEG